MSRDDYHLYASDEENDPENHQEYSWLIPTPKIKRSNKLDSKNPFAESEESEAKRNIFSSLGNTMSQSYQSNDGNLPRWVNEDEEEESMVLEEGKAASTPPPASRSRGSSKVIKWKRRPQPEYYEDDECCCCCPADPVLFAFRVFHILVGMTGVSAVAANFYCFAGEIGFREIVLRAYTILFSTLIVLVEMDWRFIVNRLRILDVWFFRGLFYTFIGFVTYGVQESVDDDRFVPTPQAIIGLVLGCLGFMYMIMGVCCVKAALNKRHRETAYTEVADDFISPAAK